MSKYTIKNVTKPAADLVGGSQNLQLITILLGSALAVYVWTKGHPVLGAVVGAGTFGVAYKIGK